MVLHEHDSPEDDAQKRYIRVIDEFIKTGTKLMIVPSEHEDGIALPEMVR